MTQTVTDRPKKVKPLLNLSKLSDGDLLARLNSILDGMTNNPAFTTPPVDMATFKAAIDSYNTLRTDALDGGKKAISARRKQREVVIKIATQLGHYVQTASNNDLATFNTSGFVAASNTRTPPQPLTSASFKWIDRGPTTGSIVVKVTGIPGAVSYDLRYAVVGAGNTPGPWVEQVLTSPKAVTLNNLTPGSTYTFQVRALGKLGYTDWCDPMTFICA
jgi:hypothetical protein